MTIFEGNMQRRKLRNGVKISNNFVFTQSNNHKSHNIGVQHKYNYFLRTIEEMDEFMLPLDLFLMEKFIPLLLDSLITATERELLSLPIRQGGLNIPFRRAEKSSNDYEISKTLTAQLAASIATQGKELPDENAGKLLKRT